jgi:hypothetical protein
MKKTKAEPSVDIVVASYGENLSWMKWIPSDWRVFLYNSKEGREDFPEGVEPIRVPNRGREAGQYLEHLVRNHGDHSDYTLFVQGMPFDHSANAIVNLLTGGPFEGIIRYVGAFPPMKPPFCLPALGPVVDLLQPAYGDRAIPPSIPFSVGAQFYVRKELIEDNPKEFYEKLLSFTKPDPADIFAYHIEGAWGCVFDWPKFL